ncbi:MAG: thiamine phosphate synthase [Deltaproteobacteria bacterium]|nr:thiamine phosphate synthase [Deltaproteobacteria bacterium]
MRFERGFYAILDRDDEPLARMLAAHADVLQVRIKPGDAADVLRVARMARRVCDEAGIRMFVNDRVDLAMAANADGVHLGQTDLPIEAARRIAPHLRVGISTHSLEQMQRAIESAPDYAAYGPVFATRTKENPDPVQGTEALARAVAAAGQVPVVAIGGITPREAASVFATGVSAVCAISSVNGADDVGAAARCLWRRGVAGSATGE